MAAPHAVAGSAGAYPYNDSDGKRQKATIEHVFVTEGAAAAVEAAQAPWLLGWQMNERNMVWNDQLKLQLIQVGMGLGRAR